MRERHEARRRLAVPEPLIVNLKSLIGALDPIQFYNRFI